MNERSAAAPGLLSVSPVATARSLITLAVIAAGLVVPGGAIGACRRHRRIDTRER